MARGFSMTFVVLASLVVATFAGNFYRDVRVTFGGERAQISGNGEVLTLSLDQSSGSGFGSNDQYLYGRFDIGMKLVWRNSAGTVTTFYSSSQGSNHDEIDFEFLGNATNQPYTLHTNIFTNGVGNREQQFRLWFDPTQAIHVYTLLWNSHNIIFMVDGIPIRVFKNYVSQGVAFPTSQPMNIYASIWDAEDWATEGGRMKTDWSYAPFTATYQNYTATACVVNGGSNSCNGNQNNQPWQNQVLDREGRNWIRWVQARHMIYNYCTDTNRFPQGLPKECTLPRF